MNEGDETVEFQKQQIARGRLERLFDNGTFTEIDRLLTDGDRPANVVAGFGTVGGMSVCAFAQEKSIGYGAICRVQAAKIRKVYQMAEQNGMPIVGIFDSDGARLSEGLAAADTLAELLSDANRLSGVVPQIAVLAGDCVGSTALLAAVSDVVIASENALWRLSENEKGASAAVIASSADEAIDEAARLLTMLPSNNLSACPAAEEAAPMGGEGVFACVDSGSLFELYPDHTCRTAFGRIGGKVCGLVALTGDPISGCSASRAARFVRLCDSFSVPIVTFVDATGFDGLKGAAQLSQAYAEATAAKLTVITGKAYGAVCVAAAGKNAGADAVYAWENAVISPLAPEAAVNLLWEDKLKEMKDPAKDRADLTAQFAREMCSSENAASVGFVTDVIAPQETRQTLCAALSALAGKRTHTLPKKHSNIPL